MHNTLQYFSRYKRSVVHLLSSDNVAFDVCSQVIFFIMLSDLIVANYKGEQVHNRLIQEKEDVELEIQHWRSVYIGGGLHQYNTCDIIYNIQAYN